MAARPRRKPTKQLDLPFKNKHGGRRKGAGRPNRSGLQAHVRRPRLTRREPVHVTLRLRDGLPSLRRKDAFRCLRQAVKKARIQGLRVAHFAILSNHIHLILEPQRTSLGRELQSLCISFSKSLNGLLKRHGSVFRERYHAHVLKTPLETRRAIAYVLTNESRHRGSAPAVRLDPYSSAGSFSEWKRLLGTLPKFGVTNWSEDWVLGWYEEIVSPPRTWLLARGWQRAANTIAPRVATR